MKLVLFTGPDLRHKYIASRLSENFSLQLVVSEEAPEESDLFSDLQKEDEDLISRYFENRHQSEQEFFPTYSTFPEDVPLRELPYGEISSEAISELVEHTAPDYIVLFDVSPLESSLLDSYRSQIVHLHPGLSPYYTGAATDLFPYFFGEPECIGATVQLVTVKEEEGEILHQLRPEMEADDDLHQIGNKVIWKAGKQLPGVLRGFAGHGITPQPRMPANKICFSSDLTTRVLKEIHQNFEKGMIKDYLHNKEQRDAPLPIVDADLQLG